MQLKNKGVRMTKEVKSKLIEIGAGLVLYLNALFAVKQWNTDRGRDSQKTAWQNDTDHLYFHLSGVCNAAFSYPSI